MEQTVNDAVLHFLDLAAPSLASELHRYFAGLHCASRAHLTN